MEQQAEASTLGMWVFLVTEIMFFGGLFMAYLVYRICVSGGVPGGQPAPEHLLGTINTAVLIGSSLTMALAVRAAQTGAVAARPGPGCSDDGLRVGVPRHQGVEYADKFKHHIVPGPNFQFEDGLPGDGADVLLALLRA